MSSCFNRDWHARRLGWFVALAALLAAGAAHAQRVTDNLPFESSASGRIYNGTTPLRLWHQTRGYGMEASQTAFGGRLAVDLADAVGLVDGQIRVSNESQFGIDFGGGYRWMAPSLITGDTRIYGITGWYDGQETTLNSYFNQAGVSLESLGEHVDFRLNANIPFEDSKAGDLVFETDELNYTRNALAIATIVPTDVALRVVDFEVAPRIFDLNAWVYGGGYQMDGEDVSDFGAKGGVRGYVTNDLAIDVGVQDDDVFGTNTVFQVIWTPGRTGAGPTSWVHTLADRMREQIYRNAYVATTQVNREGSIELTDANGQPFRIVHVDSNAAGPGDGTFENPYSALTSVNGAGSQQGDIILVHSTSQFNGQSVTMKDEQRLLGEGDNNEHFVTTSQLGQVELPATSPGAQALARPIIQNAPGAAVTLAGGTVEVENLAGMEVSNFTITGGANAVASGPNGVGDVNVNRMIINNTTGNAIQLRPLTETLTNNTTRSRFRPTIDEVTFSGVGGDDVNLDSSTNETTLQHAIAISDITSTNGNGVGINLIETQRAATITNFDWNGGATGDGALRIFESAAQGSVTLSNNLTNDENEITGGQVGTAFAISLQNSAATHTVTGTRVTDMGGDAIVVAGGSANMNFTGEIEQSVNAQSILSVTADHTGSLTFRELQTGQGVIEATTGDGLQFDDADGNYTFNDLVEFTGTSAAVNVTGDSTGVITLQEAQVMNTTGTAFTFNGGDANMTFTGRIQQNTNNGVLNVLGGHTGTLAFNELTANTGVINATMGNGLQFNNADGAYTFNDEVALSGATAVINVTAGSEGTFTFSDVDIDASGLNAAVTINASDVQAFTISGTIDSTGATARPVSITNNTGGSITFNSAITATGPGISVDGNADTTILFAGQTTLNTTTFDAVVLSNNANGGVQFNNLDITTTTGAGLNASNTDNLVVQGTGNTIATGTGTALSLNDVEVGTAGVTFATVSANGGVNGILLNNVTGGTVTVNGGTIQNTTGAAVSMTNSTNLALNNLTISAGAFQNVDRGIDYQLTTNMTSRLALNGVNISSAQFEGIRMNVDVSSGAATANLRIVNSTISNTSDDEGILLTTSGAGSKTVNLLVQGSNVSNDSATAPAASFQSGQGTLLNANVLNNQFTNTNVAPGRPFEMASNNASSIVRLNLNNNTGSATSGAAFFLEENAGAFSVEDLAATGAGTRNTGTVNFTPNQAAFSNDGGNIPLPP